ncbi:hypothetical protein MMC20_000143 [Loxospora ochrophaea]|nr:hypothetical protein [Loxospora ochrophaea]
MGLRVVCPDLMGYGGTDAPRVPPEPISYYGFRKAATDIKELAQQLGSSTVILGGHDWGGAIVYRVALWYPELVTHLFSVCTPYRPPSKTFVPLEELVKTKLPNFTYQLQFGGKSVEEAVVSRQQIREFLNLAYGGRGPNGEVGFTSREGVRLDMLSKANDTVLVSKEILEYYADQYARNGMHGPLNWYRNREINFQEELALDKSTIDIPVLFIQAKKDAALPPEMSVGMEKSIPNLSKEEVDTQHWALWEAPEQVNDRANNDIAQLLRRFENIIAFAPAEGPDRKPTTTAVEAYQMEVESAALVRAAEDILSLTRMLKEMWLFGKLEVGGERAREVEEKREEVARGVVEGLGRVMGKETGGEGRSG